MQYSVNSMSPARKHRPRWPSRHHPRKQRSKHPPSHRRRAHENAQRRQINRQPHRGQAQLLHVLPRPQIEAAIQARPDQPELLRARELLRLAQRVVLVVQRLDLLVRHRQNIRRHRRLHPQRDQPLWHVLRHRRRERHDPRHLVVVRKHRGVQVRPREEIMNKHDRVRPQIRQHLNRARHPRAPINKHPVKARHLQMVHLIHVRLELLIRPMPRRVLSP
mmetsp:Transcript_24469/g.61087  ORF Transcript_24469/g.61087 Transcript_24469/m.61087 type:complete len:219 (-) Transcript_24469:331-987(-)